MYGFVGLAWAEKAEFIDLRRSYKIIVVHSEQHRGRNGVFGNIGPYFGVVAVLFLLAAILSFFGGGEAPREHAELPSETQAASAHLSDAPEVSVSAIVTDDVFCERGIPMTTVGFLVIPLDGATFFLSTARAEDGHAGPEVPFPPGSYPLANGSYAWRAEPLPGYALSGTSSGTLLLSIECNGRTESVLGSGDAYAPPAPLLSPLLASSTPEAGTSSASAAAPSHPASEDGLYPRPILRMFIDNDPLDVKQAASGEVELRVVDVSVRSVRYYARALASGETRFLGEGEKDDLLSEGEMTTWAYFWDTAPVPLGGYRVYAALERKDGSMAETAPETITIDPSVSEHKRVDTEQAASVSPEKFFLIGPDSCADDAECRAWCGSTAARTKECASWTMATSAPSTFFTDRFGARVAIDTDRDDIVDFDERNLYGTDPLDPDTDGDGVRDGAEILARTPPLRSEDTRLGEMYAPSFAMGEGEDGDMPALRLEEFAMASPELSVLRVVVASTTDAASSAVYGRALPNAFVTLYIFSRPTIVMVRANERGDFVLTLPAALPDGGHRVYAAIVDGAGNTMLRSEKFTFTKNGTRVGRRIVAPLAPSKEEAAQADIARAFFSLAGLVFILAFFGFIVERGGVKLGAPLRIFSKKSGNSTSARKELAHRVVLGHPHSRSPFQS